MEGHDVDAMEGVEGADLVPANPLMTEDEKRILEVYDRLEELQLEIALLKQQGVLSQDLPHEVTERHITAAQGDLLKAKAAYQVRSNVIENVLIANPIITAVHAGANASAVEQDLLPLLQQRDELSISFTALSAKALEAKNELNRVQAANIIATRKNAELAAKMLLLAGKADFQRKEDISDPAVRQQYDELEVTLKTSRQRWRIMKGTASGTIAGSGIDWARDPELLSIVLDEE